MDRLYKKERGKERRQRKEKKREREAFCAARYCLVRGVCGCCRGGAGHSDRPPAARSCCSVRRSAGRTAVTWRWPGCLWRASSSRRAATVCSWAWSVSTKRLRKPSVQPVPVAVAASRGAVSFHSRAFSCCVRACGVRASCVSPRVLRGSALGLDMSLGLVLAFPR